MHSVRDSERKEQELSGFDYEPKVAAGFAEGRRCEVVTSLLVYGVRRGQMNNSHQLAGGTISLSPPPKGTVCALFVRFA